MRIDLDRALILAAAWAIFLICCVCPIAWMLIDGAGSGLRQAIDTLAAARQRVLLTETLVLGCGAAIGALGIGLPVGIVLSRCEPARSTLQRMALIVPLALPPYVLALAWILIAERAGWQVYTLPAAAGVLGFSLFPIVMLATEAAVRAISSRLEEAARLVASPWRVWSRIIVPLIAPPVAASLLIVFVLAISDFAVPSMLRTRVYTTEVFTAFSALYDFRRATLLALPLALMAAVAAMVAFRLSPSFTARLQRGQSGIVWKRSRQQIGLAILGLAGIGVIMLPIGAVVVEAGGRALFADAASIDAIQNGVVWSVSAATLVVIVGALLGYWRSRAPSSAADAMEVLWIMLFALPATIIGIGVIRIWNRPGFLGAVYRSDTIVVITYVARFLPVAGLLCSAFLRRVPSSIEEAAKLAGASWLRSFRRIVAPVAARGFAAVWLIMFILMVGDVPLSILVAPPGESNLAVRAFTLMANSPVRDVARIALVQILLSVLPVAALALLISRVGRR